MTSENYGGSGLLEVPNLPESRHTSGVLSLPCLGYLMASHLDSGTTSSQVSLLLLYTTVVSNIAVQTQASSCLSSTQMSNYSKQCFEPQTAWSAPTLVPLFPALIGPLFPILTLAPDPRALFWSFCLECFLCYSICSFLIFAQKLPHSNGSISTHPVRTLISSSCFPHSP